jgi:putative FmdB family regulatory protein
MPKYDYLCGECGARYERERPMSEASDPAPCPVCDSPGRRLFTAPKMLFKADPRDVRPIWHNHNGYSHAHAPRRGRHRLPGEDH